MPASTPAERREIAELGAHARWSRETNRSAAVAPARAGLVARFDALIPPEVTDPVQRLSMVNHAISAHLIRARRKKQAERKAARELAAAEARLAELLAADSGGDVA
jgi:hypothetical protein